MQFRSASQTLSTPPPPPPPPNARYSNSLTLTLFFLSSFTFFSLLISSEGRFKAQTSVGKGVFSPQDSAVPPSQEQFCRPVKKGELQCVLLVTTQHTPPPGHGLPHSFFMCFFLYFYIYPTPFSFLNT